MKPTVSEKITLIAEYYVQEYLALILIVVLSVAGFGTLAYVFHEPVKSYPTRVLSGEVMYFSSGGTGKTSGIPSFHVKLDSGLEVIARYQGEVPISLRGKIYLNQNKGSATGRPIYTINKPKTVKWHNKGSHAD